MQHHCIVPLTCFLTADSSRQSNCPCPRQVRVGMWVVFTALHCTLLWGVRKQRHTGAAPAASFNAGATNLRLRLLSVNLCVSVSARTTFTRVCGEDYQLLGDGCAIRKPPGCHPSTPAGRTLHSVQCSVQLHVQVCSIVCS